MENLPQYIQQAIDFVLSNHPEYKTKLGAKGKCITATVQLLFKCDELANDMCDGYLDGTNNHNDKGPHHWAVIEGYCIDLTARQFDEKDECPKIWINNNKI
jgi:hypothetical protein